MGRLFVIEDMTHCEWHGEFATLEAASAEMRRLAAIAWDGPPNAAPCTSWRTCGRDWILIEYEDAVDPWQEIRRSGTLRVNANGTTWQAGEAAGLPIPLEGLIG